MADDILHENHVFLNRCSQRFGFLLKEAFVCISLYVDGCCLPGFCRAAFGGISQVMISRGAIPVVASASQTTGPWEYARWRWLLKQFPCDYQRLFMHKKEIPIARSEAPVYRLSPVLPTPLEVKEKPDLAISDHVPIEIESIEIVDAKGFKILLSGVSFNTLTPNASSGLSFAKQENWGSQEIKTHDRNEEETNARIERVTKTIIKIDQEKARHYFTFQESCFQDEEIPKILQSLGPEWKSYPENKADRNLIFYDSSMITIWASKEIRELGEQIKEIFFTSAGGTRFVLINVHWSYDLRPTRVEQLILSLARRCRRRKIPAVIQGDFNLRFAKPKAAPAWLVTGATPAGFRIKQQADAKRVLPGADWTDAAIAIDAKGAITQLDVSLLDPETGAEIAAEKLKSLLSAFLDEKGQLRKLLNPETGEIANELKGKVSVFQAREVSIPRPCFSLDVRWQKFIIYKKTVDEVRRELKAFEHVLSLYWATNANNEPFLQLLVDQSGYQQLKKNLPYPANFIFFAFENYTGVFDYSVSAKIENFPKIYECIYKFFTLLPRPFSNPPKISDIKEQVILKNMPKAVLDIRPILQEMFENGRQVERLRLIKQGLLDLLSPKLTLTPLGQIFVKLALTNYYLRFHEYSEKEILKVVQWLEESAPMYLMRPAHFDFAITQYLEILKMLIAIDSFSPEEKSIIVAELKQLYFNINEVYKLFGSRRGMVQQLLCCDLIGAESPVELRESQEYEKISLNKSDRFGCVVNCNRIFGAASEAKDKKEEKALTDLMKADKELYALAKSGADLLSKIEPSDHKPVFTIPLQQTLFMSCADVVRADVIQIQARMREEGGCSLM